MRPPEEIQGALAATAPGAPRGLSSRFLERALAERLVDVAYAPLESPLGRLLVAATETGLVRVAYADEASEGVLGELARLSPRVLEAPRLLDPARRQLDEYFEGRRTRFELPLDLRLAAGFGRRVLEATAGIPFAQVRTYREVAAEAGNARAVRAAGNALAANPVPIVVPCHRVVRSDGSLGGYAGGRARKSLLLELERGSGERSSARRAPR